MAFSIICDEHTARQVAVYLEKEGHDVERAVEVLGTGTDDTKIVARALETDRLVLTTDTDFLTEYDAGDHAGILFPPDDKTSPYTVAMIVTEIATQLDQDAIDGVLYVTDDWL